MGAVGSAFFGLSYVVVFTTCLGSVTVDSEAYKAANQPRRNAQDHASQPQASIRHINS